MTLPSISNAALRAAREAMSPLLAEWTAKPELHALCILSSSAENPDNPTRFDQESDFDVAIVLDVPIRAGEWRPHLDDTCTLIADRIPDWVPEFAFWIQVPWGSMEVNAHQLIYQYECDPRTRWTGEKCDVFLNKSDVLCDRDGSFQALARDKAQAAQAQLVRERDRLANRITWDVREMSLRQARRLGPEAGHFLLNRAVDEVIDCVYATAGLFVPNNKWKLHHLSSRGLIDARQAALLREALRCDPACYADLERRVQALENFCAQAEGLATSGADAQEVRRRYQRTLQLKPAPGRS
ncbi:hypothetical protein [Sphaerisporangium sp. NPDC051011]|uniref:hypothetical protein n=1 Tax=Sphaerisporangium sp. NPDC051011 TaxID=3155792 RepID=UPI0033FD7A22